MTMTETATEPMACVMCKTGIATATGNICENCAEQPAATATATYRTCLDPSGTGLLTETSDGGIDVFLAEFETMDDANRIADKLNNFDALVDALKDVDLRSSQARMASGIGRESATKRVDFLRGEIERIQNVARAALATIE